MGSRPRGFCGFRSSSCRFCGLAMPWPSFWLRSPSITARILSPNPSHSLMGGLVPEDIRGRYFGERSRLMNLANFVALVSAALVV